MKRPGFLLIAAIVCFQTPRITQAAPESSADNPYLTIVRHNSFGLSPLPAPKIQDAKMPPPEITLNGIMTIFGDKCALFKVRTQPSSVEKSYLLSEGQRDGEIELLSVDVKKSMITVSDHGVIQTIAISKASLPSLIGNPAAVGGVNPANVENSRNSIGLNQSLAPEFQNTSDTQTVLQTVYQAGYAGSKTSSSTDSGAGANNNQNSGGQNAASSNPSDANSSAPKIDPWWVRGSKGVEQARAQSAEAVMNGTAEPLPLTPLTPVGTPAILIGSDQEFFDHM